MRKNIPLLAGVLVASSLLGACVSPQYPYSNQNYPNSYPSGYQGNTYPASNYPSNSYPSAYPAPAQQNYSMSGVVESVQLVQGYGPRGSGAGAVVGGVAGGILGNQVGGGAGRTAATVAGAIGGAIVGNNVEQNNSRRSNLYQISVRLDNGGYQTITQEASPDIGPGSRVRIENNRVYRY